MLFRRYCIILLLCLTCQVHVTFAKPLTEPKEVLNDNANNALLSEDLPEQLRRKLPKNKFTQWLLNFLFVVPQTSQKKLQLASYLPYQGMHIGRIQLDKQGAWNTKSSGNTQLFHIFLPTTRDGVILDQLSFASGGIIVPQQLIASQEQLNACNYIKKAKITIQEQENSKDTVDVCIATQDKFPLSIGLDIRNPSFLVTHDNLFGWGHVLENRVFYNHGLGYNATYLAPNIKNSGVTGELKYLAAQRKGIKKASVFRNFTHQTGYAGKVEVSKTRRLKKIILDGNTSPQLASFTFCHQHSWLGTALNISPGNGRFFLTGKVAHQQFVQRPEVAKNTNRYFHNYVFGVGSLGFANKQCYEEQRVYGVGNVEEIPYGSKINLIGGYQIGEFINRPYLRLDLAQGRSAQQLGHVYGAVKVSGFWHKKSLEQGILQLQLRYFSPLLSIGSQWIRQFFRLEYLAGYRMFTGELISTNASKVSKSFRDPFPGGTQRLCLGLETVLFTPRRVAGCQIAALGFVDAVRLQDAQGKVLHSGFCKALGIGFRCAHPRFSFGSLQVKIGYAPITKNMVFTISTVIASPLDDLDISEPRMIPFQVY